MANSLQSSCFAFRCAVGELWDLGKGKVRLWTFTLPAPAHEWSSISHSWKRLQRRLKHSEFDVRGLRMTEWHPKGHGWHIHWLTLAWIPVEVMRRHSNACGFGHINVCLLKDSIADYLAKHFLKDCHRCKRIRKWSKTRRLGVFSCA